MREWEEQKEGKGKIVRDRQKWKFMMAANERRETEANEMSGIIYGTDIFLYSDETKKENSENWRVMGRYASKCI